VKNARVNVRTQSGVLAARGGLSLWTHHWQPDPALSPGPRYTFALVHGICEHAGRYDGVARSLAARGCSVHAFDRRGHGRSEGVRRDAPSFAHLVDDLERFVRLVLRLEPTRSVVLLAHSFGALEAAALLAERKPPLAAAVLSGAPFAPPEALPGAVMGAARMLARLTPRVRVPADLDLSNLSRDPDVLRRYSADPLVGHSMSARMAGITLEAMDRARFFPPEIELPILMLHGADDGIAPPGAARRFFDTLASEERELRIYPGLRHEVLFEPEGEDVLREIGAFLVRRAPPAVRVQ
jgi:alpha-beta hydrolase superfamily lysophospholipase